MKKKIHHRNKLGGFEFYRTKEQILDYMKMSAAQKLRWLQEMWKFNRQVARYNPHIAKIQEKFRRGEI